MGTDIPRVHNGWGKVTGSKTRLCQHCKSAMENASFTSDEVTQVTHLIKKLSHGTHMPSASSRQDASLLYSSAFSHGLEEEHL